MGSFSTFWKCDASHLGWYSCIFLGSINKNKNPLVWFVHGHDSHCCHCQRPLSRQSWAQKSRLSSLGLTRLHSPSSSRGVLFHGVNDVNDDALSRKNLHVPKNRIKWIDQSDQIHPRLFSWTTTSTHSCIPATCVGSAISNIKRNNFITSN